jgi:hypothetical protein
MLFHPPMPRRNSSYPSEHSLVLWGFVRFVVPRRHIELLLDERTLFVPLLGKSGGATTAITLILEAKPNPIRSKRRVHGLVRVVRGPLLPVPRRHDICLECQEDMRQYESQDDRSDLLSEVSASNHPRKGLVRPQGQHI